jgi:hypothetical protein
MADWKQTAAVDIGALSISDIGDGLNLAFGKLTASITSGLGFDADGNIVVINGSGIAIDANGKVTVQAGVGLAIDSDGFIVVNTGVGLDTTGGAVFIPGGAITQSLIAALAVGQAQLQDNSVTSTKIPNAAIQTAHIGAAQITTALIANGQITQALIGDLAVGTANIQNGAVTTAVIGTAQVKTANIGDAQITTAKIGDAQITNAKINDLTADKITGGTISASVSVSTTGEFIVTGSGMTMTLSNGILEIVGSGTSAGISAELTCAELLLTGSASTMTLQTSSISIGATTGSNPPSFLAQLFGTAVVQIENMALSVINGAVSGTHLQNLGTGDTPTFAGINVSNFSPSSLTVSSLTVNSSATFNCEVFAPSYAVPGWGFIDGSANASFNSLSLPNGGFQLSGHAVGFQTVGGVANVLVGA